MTPQRPTYSYNPRPYLPSSPSSDPARLSTASGAPLSAIGNLLSTPYDTDDSDTEDTIRTPSDKTVIDPFGDSGRTNRGDRRLTQSRKMPAQYIKSVAGEVEVISFPQPGPKVISTITPSPRSPQAPGRTYNPHTSPSHGRRPVPPPSYPSPTRPGLLSSPVNPVAYHPQSQPTSQAHFNPIQPSTRPQLHLNTHMGVRYIPDLPPPASPISPLLARPPPSHSSPLPRFLGAASAGNRDSASSGVSTNESIAGYDSMKEKNALFRGGEEELLAFSPRPRIQKIGQGQGGQGFRNTWMGNRKTVVGGEFWKRFSVMGAEGMRTAKESEWLSSHNSGWKSIKRWIIIGLILFILCTGGIVTAVLLLTQG